MNVTRSKESFTEEEMQELRDRLRAYKDDHGLSWRQLGDKVGVNQTTLGLFVGGNYRADNRELAYRVFRFFLAEAAAAEMALQAPLVPAFKWTPTAKKITHMLRWAHRGKIVVIAGDPGVGKTATFKQYQEDTPNTIMVTADKATTTVAGILLAVLNASGNVSRVGGRPYTLKILILERLRALNALIIVDESQHLDDDAVEMLRALHDDLGCGLVLAGNIDVVRRVQRGARVPAFAQLHRRVSWSEHFKRPSEGDMNILLDAWNVTRPDERAFLQGIGAISGGLGTITMTLEMATIAADGTDEPRVLGHLRETYDQRVAPLLKAS